MFGYILPEKPELKVREYELFKAYYCGVCKSIGKRYGQLPRFTLNYESTFLAVLLSCLQSKTGNINIERCIAHPINKRAVVKDNEFIDYAADINVILAYYKLFDNWKDEKSILSRSGMILLQSAFKKAKNKYPDKCLEIARRLDELSELERQKCSSVDMAGEPFAKLMEEITAYPPLCEEPKTEKILRWIGYNMGKWIYVLDAYDDIEKDIKKKAYNPFICQHKYISGDLSQFKESFKSSVEFNLTYCLSEITKGFELLDKKSDSAIVENIIYMGMLRKTENILYAGSCKKVEKSV